MNWFPTVAAMTLLGTITFFYRFSFISSRGRKLARQISPDFLALLAPATFTAIIVNNLMSTQGDHADFQRKLVVAAMSIVVAFITRNVIATLVFGLGLLYVLQQIWV